MAAIEALYPHPAALPTSYLEHFRAPRHERVEWIRHGVSAPWAKRLLAELGLSQAAAFEALKLSAATVNRKAARGQALSTDESERLLGVARLIGQVESMVEESGESAGFDAAAWLSRWLAEPVPALGHARPLDLMDTMEGQTLVSETLSRMQSGAYA